MDIILLIATGALCGILGGMGMGGGTVLIPALRIFFGTPQHVAQAANLISFVPMAIVALAIHFKNRRVEKKGLWLTVLSGLVFCAAGCFVARATDGETLKRIFGGFLIVLSVVQACSAITRKRRKR